MVSLREMADVAALRLGSARSEKGLQVDNPELEARWLVEQASGYEGSEYLLALDEPATKRMVASFDSMLERRLKGEPLQYVLGRWSFRHLDVMVDRRVLIPRPETELVTGVALEQLRRLGGDERATTVVDLGTGSGVIALSIAVEAVHSQVWAVDRSAQALEIARANLVGIGRPAMRVRMLEGDWFDALPEELYNKVDLIVANPPYVAEYEIQDLPKVVAEWEPIGALVSGPSGLEDLDHIVATAPTWLARPGALVLECAPHQVDPVASDARNVGFDNVTVFDDLTGRHRGILATLSG